MRCKVESTENPRSFEKYPTSPYRTYLTKFTTLTCHIIWNEIHMSFKIFTCTNMSYTIKRHVSFMTGCGIVTLSDTCDHTVTHPHTTKLFPDTSTATHCNTLQHNSSEQAKFTATGWECVTWGTRALQHTATHCNWVRVCGLRDTSTATHCITLRITATHQKIVIWGLLEAWWRKVDSQLQSRIRRHVPRPLSILLLCSA